MLPKILPGADGEVVKAAQSSQPVGNRERKTSADVGRVCTAWQQELADLAWLLIEVGLELLCECQIRLLYLNAATFPFCLWNQKQPGKFL